MRTPTCHAATPSTAAPGSGVRIGWSPRATTPTGVPFPPPWPRRPPGRGARARRPPGGAAPPRFPFPPAGAGSRRLLAPPSLPLREARPPPAPPRRERRRKREAVLHLPEMVREAPDEPRRDAHAH